MPICYCVVSSIKCNKVGADLFLHSVATLNLVTVFERQQICLRDFSEDAVMQYFFSFEQMVTILFMDYLVCDALLFRESLCATRSCRKQMSCMGKSSSVIASISALLPQGIYFMAIECSVVRAVSLFLEVIFYHFECL